MDKQKQIEEMAKVVRKYYSGFSEYKVVEEIYRILIPDGAVVLIDKKDIQQYEWSKLVDKMGVIEFGEKICKETAEKFARLVEFHSVSTRDEEGREIFTISALGLKEILHEEFGIPYEEITEGKV